jgi:hypothetical protein
MADAHRGDPMPERARRRAVRQAPGEACWLGESSRLMETFTRSFAVLALLAALGAAGTPTTVTVTPSNLTFKRALAVCAAGTLGSITLSLGHVRVSEAPGVSTDIDDTNPSAQLVTLSTGTQSATATVNASKNTVTAAHVTLESARRVACVAPD